MPAPTLRPTAPSLAALLGLPLCTAAIAEVGLLALPRDYEHTVSYLPLLIVVSGFAIANRWFDWAPVEPRTRALAVTRRAFVAPAHLARRAVFGGFLLSFAACAAALPLSRGHWFALVVYSPALVGALLLACYPRRRVELRPHGVVLRWLGGSDVIGWDQITLIAYGPRGPSVTVYSAGRGTFELPVRSLVTDPAFLADALWFYRLHPACRPDIGTAAGYERLLPELDRLRATPPPTLPSAQAWRP